MDLNKIEKQLYQSAKPFLSVMDNDSHTLDVLELAFRLLSGEGGERNIIIPAAILHDVGWSEVPEKIRLEARSPTRDIRLARIHELEGLKIAKNLLDKASNKDLPVVEILKIIDGHDTRKEAISLNDKILRDADKLSRYSALFWDITEWLETDPQTLYKGLESMAGKWFYLTLSKDIAHEKLIQRREEIKGRRLLTGVKK